MAGKLGTCLACWWWGWEVVCVLGTKGMRVHCVVSTIGMQVLWLARVNEKTGPSPFACFACASGDLRMEAWGKGATVVQQFDTEGKEGGGRSPVVGGGIQSCFSCPACCFHGIHGGVEAMLLDLLQAAHCRPHCCSCSMQHWLPAPCSVQVVEATLFVPAPSSILSSPLLLLLRATLACCSCSVQHWLAAPCTVQVVEATLFVPAPCTLQVEATLSSLLHAALDAANSSSKHAAAVAAGVHTHAANT